MAVRTSNTANESTVKDFKLYTGVIPYKVVAVNPNLKELQEMGIDYMKEEPEYIVEQTFNDNTVKSTIIDFWIQSLPNPEYPELDILNNIRFRVNHEPWVGNNSNKKQFINKYGRTAWADNASLLGDNKYFKNESCRQAHRGEEELHKFLFGWLNMSYDDKTERWDECLLDINKLIKGDFSELKSLVEDSPNFKVKILTGVLISEKDGKIRYYQTFYNKMFLKHNQTSTNRLQEFISKDEYNEFKTDYYTFDIQEFDKSVKPDEDPVKEPEEVF